MRFRFVRIAALLLMIASGVASAQSDALATRTDSIARAVLARTGEPSASVAVVMHGRLAYAQAYGDARLDPRTPATPAMRYAIGSVSKQIAAAAVLLLQEEGKMHLDDRVERWVPGLTRGRDVTIRQLLSHTSGYQDFWPQDYVPPEMQHAVPASTILDRWGRRALDFEPGSRWQYSNTNFVIAALAVEKASGVPFYTFIRRRILNPLGMTSASDFDGTGHAAIDPEGYMRFALGPLHPAIPTGPGWMYGAGELSMTASDLAKWDMAMIKHSLLRRDSWRQMETIVLLNDGSSSGYGLGVDVGRMNGHRTISHGGEVAGFTSDNLVFPDDSAAVIVFVNQDAASSTGLIAQGIASTLFKTDDSLTTRYTARVRGIIDGLAHGTLDRSLFTSNANAYFSTEALRDFQASLAPLGTPTSVTETRHSLRGGMMLRSYRVVYPSRTLSLWTYEMPDGLLEQLQIAPAG